MKSFEAYMYAFCNYTKSDFDLDHYQKIVSLDPQSIYYFAQDIPGADIEYCQEHACKSMHFAYLFARDIPGADIKYCQEHACKHPREAYYFAEDIPEADLQYCRKACEHDEYWLNEFDRMIIEKCLI